VGPGTSVSLQLRWRLQSEKLRLIQSLRC